jgi:hypothetical protein
MARRDPDFTADGLYLPDDLAAMAEAFNKACTRVGALADRAEVRRAMAVVVSQQYEMGIRRTDRMIASAAALGSIVARDLSIH